ncbi:anti-anti-sigma factor [Nonomuraea solani]|uniref:Anti-sigma factor antagonist n=1 Tax=Nonomuraea solani TaxID=1144553 RepID=A0A1H6EPE9_9ACTN|nr:STAS domain-containing protein [Nonomuraea solani]SEG99748.1 anti-anti-sigma factor [Nonomuraea solani]
MNLTSRHLPGMTLITVTGQVDASTSGTLEAYLDQVRRTLHDHLVVDVSRLSFLDSSGLAVLLAAATLARAHGAGLHLAGPQPRVARILEITGAWQAVNVYDHIEQAIAAVQALGRAEPTEPA